MLTDVGMMAVVLLFGNLAFWHFEPYMRLWKRFVKTSIILLITAAISYYFGRRGVFVALGIAAVPLVYVHGFWLPRNGVNGWTGEPREKYYALRGWTLPPEAVAPQIDRND